MPRLPLACAIVALLLLPAAPRAQDPPLPDKAAFLEAVKANLRRERGLDGQYTYVETRRTLKTDARGQRRVSEEQVFEIYPGVRRDDVYRRLVKKNGQPVPKSDLDKADAKRRKAVLEEMAARERETPDRRARRERAEAEERRKDERELDDAFRVYEVTLDAREVVDGRPVIVGSFTPRKDARPTTDAGRIMTKFRGRAWVSEQDHELVRMEAEAIDTLSFGLGLLARVHKGSRATFERRRVNDEVWLPASARILASARVFLFKGIRLDQEIDYSDYRKATGDARVVGFQVKPE